MKHHKISAIIFLLLTVVLIFSSCSLRDSEPEISRKIEDTPEPDLVIKGKNGLGMFKLTVTDEISRISTLEFTDALPSDSIDELPNGIEAKRVYQITLSLDKVERSNRISNDTVITFDRYVLSADNGYKISVRTVFSGQGVRKHLEGEKQKLKDALDRGEISQQAYQRSLSILDGDYILYESGESFKVTVTAYSNGSAYLSRAEYDADGDGIFETSTSTDETAHNVIIKKTYGTSVLTVRTSLSGNVISEALGAITGKTVVPVYEKLLDSDGRTTTYLEYHENGRLKKGTDYFENEIPKYITEYGENGIKTRTIEYYSSGNHKKETVYYESGSVKTRFEYEDKKDSTPIRTDYIEGSNKPIPDGEAVDIDKFVNDFGGFWMSKDSEKGVVVISVCEDMTYINLPNNYGINESHFIDSVTLIDGCYHVGIKNGSEGSVCDYIVLKTNGQMLTVNDSSEVYVLDPDREYLGDLPSEPSTKLPITDLDKFIGTWTEFNSLARFSGIKLTDNGYVWYNGYWETDAYGEAIIKGLYTNGNGKYTVAYLYETRYNGINDSIEQGGLYTQSFYELRSGTYRQIALLNNSRIGYSAYILHPQMQLPYTDNNIHVSDPYTLITPSEIAKIFEGVWETDPGIAYNDPSGIPKSSIGFGIVNGSPVVAITDTNGNTDTYYLSSVTYDGKLDQFVMTLTNPNIPPVSERSIELRFTPHANYKSISVYKTGSYSSFDIFVYNKDKKYPDNLHSGLTEGVKISFDNIDALLGTWSEATERRDMLHLYKEDGKYLIIAGRHGEQYTEEYEITEVRLANTTYILRCKATETFDGKSVICEKLIFIRYHKNDQHESYKKIGQLYEHFEFLSDDINTLYYKDARLTFPLEEEFPYSLPVLDRLTDEQLCAAIGGHYTGLYSTGSVTIELRDGKAIFTMNNVKGLNGEYILSEAFESYYYKTYKLTLTKAESVVNNPITLYIRPGTLYDRFQIIEKIDNDMGAITYYKE